MDKKKNIEEILRKKFESHELPVKKELWEAVSSQLASAGATTGGVAGIAHLTKWILGGIAAAVITTAVVLLGIEEKNNESTIPQQRAESVDTSFIQPKIDTISQLTQPSAAEVYQPNQTVTATADQDKWLPIMEEDVVITEDARASAQENPPTVDTTPPASNTVTPNHSTPIPQESQAQPSLEIFYRLLDETSMRYLFFSSAAGAPSYAWYLDGELHSQESNFSYAFHEGKHRIDLIVVDENGVESRSSKDIETYPNLKFNLPNAFSPGKDNMNDTFDVEKGVENEKQLLLLLITDKYGKTVYSSKSRFVWDGNLLSGDPAPAGTYTYTIQLIDKKNSPQTKGGVIQLFRE